MTAPTAPAAVVNWRTLAVVAGTTAVAVMLLALLAGGGAPERPPAGIPDPGTVTKWGLPFLALVQVLAAVVTVAHLLLIVMLPRRSRRLTRTARRLLPLVGTSAAVWWVAVLLRTLFEVSDRVAEPLPGALRGGTLTSYATDLPDGRAALVVLALTLPLALFASTVSSARGAHVLLLVGVAALLPPAAAGHSAGSGNPALAAASLAVHIAAVTLWVGGVTGLLVHARTLGPTLDEVLPVFSRLALACFLAVAVSGTANALLHTPLGSLVGSPYGGLLAAKIGALAALGAIGVAHRRRVLAHLTATGRDAFVRLGVVELVLMAATLGLAAALSRTPPPV